MKIIMKPIFLLLLVLFVNSCASVKQADEPVSVTAIPTDVSAEAGNGKVTIRWNGVSGADSYNVYMSLSPGTLKKNFGARKTTTSTSYSWTGLSNGTSYYFVVTALKKDRESNGSSEVTATPKVIKEAPKAPEPAPKVPKEAPKAPEAAPETAPKAAPKASKLTPQELLIKADDLRAPGKNFVTDIKVTFKKGNTETSSRLVTRVKGFNKSLAIYKEPPSQKDQVLLMIENNMWIYFPATRQPIRIAPAQQLLGQVSNADVARVVYNIDYKAESVEDDSIGNDKLLKLFLKAKTEGAAYGSIKLWMNKDSERLYKAEFYTLAGRVLKTVYYKGYKQLLGKERPTIFEIHDAVKKDEITTMEYLSMKIEDTPDNYFQRSFMDRAPQL